jgi:hypothetical protein
MNLEVEIEIEIEIEIESVFRVDQVEMLLAFLFVLWFG